MVREMRKSSVARTAGRAGIGESLVKTTEEPVAWMAVHGQLAGQDALRDATTATEVRGLPS
jgi:hypothetical protein